MTKEEAEKRIQELLSEAQTLADEHKVEFSWLGCTYHLLHETDDWDEERKEYVPVTIVADKGILLSDDEWESSNCYGPKDTWFDKQIYTKLRG